MRQIDRFATDFYNFLVEKSHKNTFSICQTVGGNVADSFLRCNTYLDRAFPVFKAHPGILHAICGGKWIAETGLVIFSTCMSPSITWENDYLLGKYLIIFDLYIIWNVQVKSGNCYFALFIGKYEN